MSVKISIFRLSGAIRNICVKVLNHRLLVLMFICCLMILVTLQSASGQEKSQMVRLAKIQIDPAKLESYKALLKEEIEASVKLEPGVLTLYAVFEKDNPTHITILEIYADTNAYEAHTKTPHFLKYKTDTKEMVTSLELVNTVPLLPGMKIK